MYVDTTSYFNAMKTGTSTTEASSELGKDAFLTLFVAQLENQDPLNPLENTEMVAQLAQFSSLEQLTNISESLETVLSAVAGLQHVGATSYIGKDVLAGGDSIALADGKATEVTYVIPLDATNVYAHIYDADGNLVGSIEIGDVEQGEHDFTWDGKDATGKACSDGTYYVAFTGTDADGDYLSISTMVEGRVTGVSTSGGSIILSLADGRSVALSNVYEVRNPTTSGTDDTDTTGDTGDSGDDSGDAA